MYYEAKGIPRDCSGPQAFESILIEYRSKFNDNVRFNESNLSEAGNVVPKRQRKQKEFSILKNQQLSYVITNVLLE